MKTVNLKEAKRLNAILAGSIPKPDPYEKQLKQMGEFLFFYSVWTFVQRKQASTLSETQVKSKLEQYPEMEVYYYRLVKSSDRTPTILKGRKIEKEEIHSHEELSELIYSKTGASVSESELMIKRVQNQVRTSGVSVDRIRALNKSIEKEKSDREEIERIAKCLKENDLRRRKECLNNCKSK